jgi:hypothetical protein
MKSIAYLGLYSEIYLRIMNFCQNVPSFTFCNFSALTKTLPAPVTATTLFGKYISAI